MDTRQEGLHQAIHHPRILQAVPQGQGPTGQGTHKVVGHPLLHRQVMPTEGLAGRSHLQVTALGRHTLEVKVVPRLRQQEARLVSLSPTRISFRYDRFLSLT